MSRSDVDEHYFFKKAEAECVNPAVIVGESHMHELLANKKYWHDVNPVNDDDIYAIEVNLLAGMDDPIANFSRSIAGDIQFPESSVYLHALGVMSAIMVPNFYFQFVEGGGENTVALYTVVAQPPSSGKSFVNDKLIEKANECFEVLSTKNEIEREVLKYEIRQIEAEKKTNGPSGVRGIVEQIVEKNKMLKQIPLYRWFVNDPTPEGCEDAAINNNGFFNIVSDESSAVKVALGMVYGGNGAKNNGIFLKAWDNGQVQVARQSRIGFSGRIRGAFAVLAQDVSISSILKVGMEGEGVSERALILREKTLMGSRKREARKAIDRGIKDIYDRLVENVVMSGKTVLTPSPAALEFLDDFQDEIEPELGDHGKFSSSMLRGFAGKSGKHILKLASVLHVAVNWSGDHKKSRTIEMETVVKASIIFKQLLQTYIVAADSKGFTGINTETSAIVEKLKARVEKGVTKIRVQSLRDSLKNVQPFSDMARVNDHIRKKYIPWLQENNYVVYHKEDDMIYINPRLRG